MSTVFVADHYSIKEESDDGMALLRSLFPDGKATTMNLCLFSTSGVHGSYQTIEEEEEEPGDGITFLVIQPRIVSMTYGNAFPQTPDDFHLLKTLRASSKQAVLEIGED